MVEPADGGGSVTRRTAVEMTDDIGSPGNAVVPNLMTPLDNIRKTVLEPIEEASQVAPPKLQTRKKTGSVQRYHPSIRPPMARLLVLDDCGTNAEIIRIRSDRFRIGRTGGDLMIPHDGQMSSEHAEISRQRADRQWTWTIQDLNSTNGTFFRVTEAALQDQQELIIGTQLYRFANEQAAIPETLAPEADNTKTLVAGGATNDAGASSSATASLTEVRLDGGGKRIALQTDQWIGRDKRRCQIILDDPAVGAQEARIFRDKAGQWTVKRGKSQNGLWVRVESVTLTKRGTQFQCGEQRFELRMVL
jgi:pSer/pThr/pTyr-binding forkhead associated (FHA) protein